MNTFKWSKAEKLFALAPMANITTLPFRSICREMGADVVFTPMLSSNAVVYNTKETLKIAEFLPKEQPVIVQIFGYSGELMAQAAEIIEKELKPAGIDINMGCPAPKITGNECGSALLKNFDNALEIAKKVREANSGELSVKLRLGWDKPNIIEFVKKLEEIGVNAVSIHGRTTKQGYRGEADWDEIYRVASSASIPVIGNGDINSWEIAYKRLGESELKGVMIGRATLGNPWIFKEIKQKKDIARDMTELTRVIEDQTQRYISFSGEERAVLEMRKHFGWYIKGFPGAQEIRKEAVMATTMKDVKQILDKLKERE